ncbi:MAG: TIGR02757 family protein [Actinobacteria bacterium]|nr:TIGR02757 family protein [Actinomycetota bacterium]
MELGEQLQELYEKYNDKKFVHPDPLEFLYNYSDIKDREIAGLIASLLAYGRVAQILKSVSLILNFIGEPFNYLNSSSRKDISNAFSSFKHRFTTGEDVSNLLYAVKEIIREYGSLENCFCSGMSKEDESVLPALRKFIKKFGEKLDNRFSSLLSIPEGSSAFKRFNLYLRWMVRKDNVDPGGWENIPASKLIIPLDTHMYRICSGLNFTNRKQADIKSALSITNCFKIYAPDDPVKFDFALTRLGMNRDEGLNNLFRECLTT